LKADCAAQRALRSASFALNRKAKKRKVCSIFRFKLEESGEEINAIFEETNDGKK
jgi:hypothetical protein